MRRMSSSPGHFHSHIPMLRTVHAACLHRLSTGLCTARLDARTGCRQTVGAVRYNGRDRPRGRSGTADRQGGGGIS
jgi:hypothetical protein